MSKFPGRTVNTTKDHKSPKARVKNELTTMKCLSVKGSNGVLGGSLRHFGSKW